MHAAAFDPNRRTYLANTSIMAEWACSKLGGVLVLHKTPQHELYDTLSGNRSECSLGAARLWA